jgi:hypothetical protein
MRNTFTILVGQLEVKRPVGRPRRRREDNVKINVKVVGCEAMGWTLLAQDRAFGRALVNMVMNLRVS